MLDLGETNSASNAQVILRNYRIIFILKINFIKILYFPLRGWISSLWQEVIEYDTFYKNTHSKYLDTN